MSRRDDKYADEEDVKPTGGGRPRRLRREDEDITDGPAEQKSSVRDEKGRDRDYSPKNSSSSINDDPAPKPRRRRESALQSDGGDTGGGGGWMTGAPSTRKMSHNTPVVEDGNLYGDIPDVAVNNTNQNKHFDMNKDEGEIVMIPDLEDDGGGEVDGRVARAPRNLNRKIPTLAELESEARAAIMMGESGLDMSVLLNTLVPPAMLQEEDSTWTFESLLREITEELLPLLKSDEENGNLGVVGSGQ